MTRGTRIPGPSRLVARLLLTLPTAAMLAVTPSVAASQPAAGTRFDTALVRTLTVGSMVTSARTALAVGAIPASDTLVRPWVARLVARLERPAVMALPLAVVAEAAHRAEGREAGFARVARWKRAPTIPGWGAGDAADLDTLVRLTAIELRRGMESRTPEVPEDSVDLILEPLTALNASRLTRSLAQSLEKLNRYERKYGPHAPQLNIAEVGLNFVAQWVPLFAPNAEGWPSRFEMIASYVPSYLTVVDEKATPVTVGEFGVRGYLWKRGWGGDEGGVWRPGYFSFGLAMAGPADGAFQSPFRGERRLGAFFGWGGAKLAVIGGRDRRILVTRQLQVIPWAF